ncbi:MAG: DUF3667 domain-containing protein [Planctomycetota bacterium]
MTWDDSRGKVPEESDSANAVGANSKLGTVAVSSAGGSVQSLNEFVGSSTCASCGAEKDGEFCSQCGQRHLKARLTLGPLLRELFVRITDIDRGLFHTFWSLLCAPGRVAKDYISGNQRKYLNPLTIFFIGAATQLLGYWVSDGVIREQFRSQTQVTQQTEQAEDFRKSIEERTGVPFEELMLDTYLSSVKQSYTYSALFFYAFPFALLLGWFHRARGEHYYVAEMLVFALYIFGFVLVITGLLTPITVRLSSTLHAFMGPTVYVVIPQIAHGAFFQRTWLARLLTMLASLISLIPFLMASLVIFIATAAVKIIFAG